VRFLLDEGIDIRLGGVLRALGHDADHILELGGQGAPDDEVVRLAADYDVLITLDPHRQDAEWVVVNEAMLQTVRVIRMRFTRSEQTSLLDQTRMLVARWRDWEHRIQNEAARLVMLTHAGTRVRTLTREQLEHLLQARGVGEE
jgi:hypothetical protein